MTTKAMIEFGERLRDARIEAYLGQAHLADLLGVDVSFIPRWESGEWTVSRDDYNKITKVLPALVDVDLENEIVATEQNNGTYSEVRESSRRTSGRRPMLIYQKEPTMIVSLKLFEQLMGKHLLNREMRTKILDCLVFNDIPSDTILEMIHRSLGNK